MKQNTLEALMEKYREGTLQDEERVLLERLAGQEEVMAAAERKARRIVRQRRTFLFSAVAVIAIAASIIASPHQATPPMVAEVQPLPASPTSPATPASLASPPAPLQEERGVECSVSTPPRLLERGSGGEAPTVVCNNQCEADSVINDIWKFLSV